MEGPLKVSAALGDADEYRAQIWQRRSMARSPRTVNDPPWKRRQRRKNDGTAGLFLRCLVSPTDAKASLRTTGYGSGQSPPVSASGSVGPGSSFADRFIRVDTGYAIIWSRFSRRATLRIVSWADSSGSSNCRRDSESSTSGWRSRMNAKPGETGSARIAQQISLPSPAGFHRPAINTSSSGSPSLGDLLRLLVRFGPARLGSADRWTHAP